MTGAGAVFKREFSGYFATPVALVFIVIFLLTAGVFTFELGGFYDRYQQADLSPFFSWHPWLYLFLIPALAMRLWAEERRTGTVELLLTLPISPTGAVVGKYLAAWLFAGLSLALTFPMWWTVNFLGDPDNGAILTAYLGSFLMAGAFLAIGELLSACTKNQVIAFILTVVVCLVLLLAGLEPVIGFFRDWAPPAVTDAIAGFSFLTRFEGVSRGVVEARDLFFFGSIIGACLLMTVWVVQARKAE
ncbi:MAG TPA: ABC transporter permease [Phycisphaerales bacterium]|nr:ABC transporter permease [Phycisphaerales bacterium]